MGLNFVREWRDLQFNFQRDLRNSFIVIARSLLRANRRGNIFFNILFDAWPGIGAHTLRKTYLTGNYNPFAKMLSMLLSPQRGLQFHAISEWIIWFMETFSWQFHIKYPFRRNILFQLHHVAEPAQPLNVNTLHNFHVVCIELFFANTLKPAGSVRDWLIDIDGHLSCAH